MSNLTAETLCFRPAFSKGFTLLLLEAICLAIRFRLTLSNGFHLSPTRCTAAHSCRHELGELTTMVNLAASLFARLAASFRSLT